MEEKTIFSKETSHFSESHEPDPAKELSPNVQKLINSYKDYKKSLEPQEKVPVIHVDEIASKVAAAYETVIRVINWKEEQLVRRTAIERKLKRRLITEISGIKLASDIKPAKAAETLVLESIRGGHLPNDQIPQNKIDIVQKILEKYIYILKHNLSSKDHKNRVQFYNWTLEIAACEIEETLAPPIRENALISSMATLMENRIQMNPLDIISDEDKRIQIFIAVHQTLFHLDDPIISYRLLKYRYPDWNDASFETIDNIANNIIEIRKNLDKDLHHPLSGKFFKLCEKYDTLWLLLSDVLDNLIKNEGSIEEKFSNQKTLKNLLREAYDKRLKTLRRRLLKMAIFSTLSILIANSISLFVVEVPLARWLYGHFNPKAMAADIIGPTIFMLLLTITTKKPPKNNLEVIAEEIGKIIYSKKENDVYEIKVSRGKNYIFNFFIGLFYLVAGVVSLGAIVWALRFFGLPPTSIFINTMIVAVIVFSGLVIRQRAKEIIVYEKLTVWEFILDVLSLPVAKVGQWLSSKWKKYNIVSVFITALIDMPFLGFINFIESWSSFLKEKKAELH